MIRAAVVILALSLYVAILGPIILIHIWLTSRLDFAYRVSRAGVRLGLLLGGIKLKVVGLEKVQRYRAYVFMANHQSNCDGPILFYILPQDVKVFVKREMMRLPILARAMRLGGFIAIDRSSPKSARREIEEAIAGLKRGNSFLIFPEGTRSYDGKLLRFKTGGFIVAIKAQVPILPITINNSRKVMAKGQASIRPGTIEIIFHDPVKTDSLSLQDCDRLALRVRQIIASALVET